MPSLDLIDETFVVVSPATLAQEVARPDRWARWWPDLRLRIFMDRGIQGLRWSVTGALVGSSEIWLEPVLDGVLLHYYVRAELASGARRRRVDEMRREHAVQWKRDVWALKRDMEGGRRPGCPRVGEE